MINDERAARVLAAKMTRWRARYRWRFGKKSRAEFASIVDGLLRDLLKSVREEEKRERQASNRITRAQTMDRICASLRRSANLQRDKIRKRKVAPTYRAKALPKLLEQIADNLEKPPKTEVTTEKPTRVEDD